MSAVYSFDTEITINIESKSPIIIEDGITLQISNATLVGQGEDITLFTADFTFADFVETPISIYSP